MGCDIHGVVQVRYTEDGPWQTVDAEFEDSRNYVVFAALADVRNGFGFAGVETHRPIEPIAEPRGLPEGFEIDTRCVEASLRDHDCSDPEDYCGVQHWYFLPDSDGHSQSWLTLQEILEWPGWSQTLASRGIVERSEYERMARTGESKPRSWSGGVWGGDVIIANHGAGHFPEGWNFVELAWTELLSDRCETFLNWCRWIQAKYSWTKDIRIVFAFDN